MSERAITVRTTLDIDDGAATKRTAQLMKHRGGLFPTDMTEAQAAIMARLSLLYELDPLMDELILYQGKPYLTLKGALRVAIRDDRFRGIECVPATPAERDAFRVRDDEQLWVARVHRAGWDVPIVGYGRASASDDQPVARRWTAEMAQKRAKHRALRDAFSLPVPGVEEAGDPVADAPRGPVLEGVSRPVVDAAPAVAPERVAPMAVSAPDQPAGIRPDQISAIHAIGHAIGWITRDDDTAYRDALMATFGVVTSKDLTANQAAAFIEVLVREQEHMIVDDAPAHEPASLAWPPGAGKRDGSARGSRLAVAGDPDRRGATARAGDRARLIGGAAGRADRAPVRRGHGPRAPRSEAARKFTGAAVDGRDPRGHAAGAPALMAGYGHAAALVGPTRAVPERLCSACGARFLAPRRARDFRVLCPGPASSLPSGRKRWRPRPSRKRPSARRRSATMVCGPLTPDPRADPYR